MPTRTDDRRIPTSKPTESGLNEVTEAIRQQVYRHGLAVVLDTIADVMTEVGNGPNNRQRKPDRFARLIGKAAHDIRTIVNRTFRYS